MREYVNMALNGTLYNPNEIFKKYKNPKIPIVIAVYNGEGYLRDALLSIQNQDFKDIEIKPITILCGSNICGKSSMLESILLLKQTIRNMNSANGIVFNGDYMHLGDFENVVFAHDLKNDIEMSYSFIVNTSNKRVQ